jgi:hypothetical protein
MIGQDSGLIDDRPFVMTSGIFSSARHPLADWIARRTRFGVIGISIQHVFRVRAFREPGAPAPRRLSCARDIKPIFDRPRGWQSLAGIRDAYRFNSSRCAKISFSRSTPKKEVSVISHIQRGPDDRKHRSESGAAGNRDDRSGWRASARNTVRQCGRTSR